MYICLCKMNITSMIRKISNFNGVSLLMIIFLVGYAVRCMQVVLLTFQRSLICVPYEEK
jgi:hypothetical protein